MESYYDQLRKEYHNVIDEYGSKFFDLVALDKRILHHLSAKGDVKNFIKEEMEFLEHTKGLLNKHQNKKKSEEAFQGNIDAILAKHRSKIEKYPDANFYLPASFDLRHLVGAVSSFYEEFCLTLENFRGYHPEIKNLIFELSRFYYHTNKPLSPFLLKYVQETTQYGIQKKKNMEQSLMQTMANILNQLSFFCASSLEECKKDPSLNKNIIVQHSDPKVASTDDNIIPITTLLSNTIEASQSIIRDFRLESLVDWDKKK